MHVLGVSQLHHQFGRPPEALRGIDLELRPATMTAIMGPSGSGKSTLLNCLAGLLKPTRGQVRYRGDDLAGLNQRQLDRLRRTSWGFIFQAYNLIDALTAIENVKLPALFGGSRMPDAIAVEALRQVGLDGLEGRYPDQLSGGQRQRVAIARALATSRDVVFADEPTGALDSEARREVMQHLRELPNRGSTVVLVTHDPTVAADAARILVLYDGSVVADEQGLSARQISDRLVELEARSCSG